MQEFSHIADASDLQAHARHGQQFWGCTGQKGYTAAIPQGKADRHLLPLQCLHRSQSAGCCVSPAAGQQLAGLQHNLGHHAAAHDWLLLAERRHQVHHAHPTWTCPCQCQGYSRPCAQNPESGKRGLRGCCDHLAAHLAPAVAGKVAAGAHYAAAAALSVTDVCVVAAALAAAAAAGVMSAGATGLGPWPFRGDGQLRRE